MSIKVGDRVVCIDDKYNHGTNLKKNREYIVYDILRCGCGCGQLLLDVGLTFLYPDKIIMRNCASCGNNYRDTTPTCLRINRFRKVEERTNYVKLEIEIEEPIYS